MVNSLRTAHSANRKESLKDMVSNESQFLNSILEEMVENVTKSKGQVFRIVDQSRNENERLTTELEKLKLDIQQSFEEQKVLESKSRLARKKLAEVNQDFKNSSPELVKSTYEYAHQIHVNLLIHEEKEKQMINRRNDIERRLRELKATIEHAELLISRVSVILSFLSEDMKEFGAALEHAQTKQVFALQIMKAQEEERKKLSREIHDGPAQMLANVLIRSELIERLWTEKGVEYAFEEIRHMKKTVRSTLSEVRQIIYNLRPMALDDLGLFPTLKKYLKTTNDYIKESGKGTSIEFINLGMEKRLPGEIEVALFRLVQESVQNAIKHASASLIQVKVEMKTDRIICLIKDDGTGFNVQEKSVDSFGIMGMQERTDLLNGKITIQSKIKQGTTVLISVPLEEYKER
ncbi:MULTISPECIES: sensor histidine kinase [Pseudobacillus]|uniref:sensor histidine kinase n=1 Tax=Pseudobacillus TaxID=108525 RepID=UPI0038793256